MGFAEAAVLIDHEGSPVYWHSPPGRSAVYLPDSLDLWQKIWSNRENLLGIAHTHPGSGCPSPSSEDLSTFQAIEMGLGRRLTWWIVTFDYVLEMRWLEGVGYWPKGQGSEVSVDPSWVSRLRLNSRHVSERNL